MQIIQIGLRVTLPKYHLIGWEYLPHGIVGKVAQIAFIQSGKLLKIGTPGELKSSVQGSLLEVACRPLMKASKALEKLEGLVAMTAYGTTLHVNVHDEERAKRDIREIAKRERFEVESISAIPASLEDVFATLTEGAAAS